MDLLLVPVLVPFLFFLPGYLISRTLFRNPGAFSAGERWFLPLALSVGTTTWIAFSLAEFGVYSLFHTSALVLAGCALLLLGARRKFVPWALEFRPDWIFLATLALAIFLFARPAEYFVGNSDAGTYVDTGASIARTGGIAIYDAQVAQLPPDPAKTFYWQLINPYMLYTQVRLPGFFIADQAQGLVLPQFLHFYPVWIALWDSLLGLRWGLFATPIVGLLGSAAFYFLARQLLGRNFGRLAFFLLVITVPQFWFARYPVAEAMTQFLVLTGMWALLKMMGTKPAGDKPRNAGSAPGVGEPVKAVSTANGIGLGLVAGVAFGQVFFTRADAILLLVPLALYGLVLVFWRRWRMEHWALFGAFGVVLAQAVAHMLVFAPNYLYFQYSHAMRMQNLDKLLRIQLPDARALFTRIEYLLVLVAAGVLGLIALVIVDRLVQVVRRRAGGAVERRYRGAERLLRYGAAALVAVLFVAFYFVLSRPESLYAYVGGLTPARSEANLIKLGWYLSPIGIGLAALGGMVVLVRDWNARNAFFYGTAALFALLYLDELYSTPHYIYTTRHYIPLVIPLLLVLAVRALKWLWQEAFAFRPGLKRAARWAAAGAFGLWLLYNVYAMGLVDASRAQGFAVRVPFVSQTLSLGMVRLEPFENSIAGVFELGGAYDQLEALAQRVDPNAVIVLSAGRDEPAILANPLKFVFGRDAFVTVFNNPPGAKVAGMIDAWRAAGREVILAYGTNGGKLQIPNYSLEPIGEYSFTVPQWAFAYNFMPRSAWQINLNYALYRAVPAGAPEAYPFVLNFGGADYPYLVNGFLERSSEAQTRWIGTLVGDDPKAGEWKWTSGSVWVPASSGAEELEIALRARAPRDGVRFQLKSAGKVLGNAELGTMFDTYVFRVSPAALRTNAGGYVLELVSQTTLQEGRVLGAELESLQVTGAR